MKFDYVIFLAILIAVVCPTLPVFGNPENISALLLLLVVLTAATKTSTIFLLYGLFTLFGLICISTIAGLMLVNVSYSISPYQFGVYFRIFICIQAMQYACDPNSLHRWLLWLGAGTSLFAFLQFIFPDSVGSFTAAFYLHSDRSTVWEDFQGTSNVRVIGFFENPSLVALISIAFILLSIRAYSVDQLKRKTLMLFIVLHLAAGILSLSKVFFIGLPLIMLQLGIMRYRSAVFSVALASIVGFVLMMNSDETQVQLIRYAFNSAINPEHALSGRYLNEAMLVLERSWVFGYGLVAIQSVVINDSAYMVLGYLVGTFGVMVIATLSCWWLWNRRSQLSASLYLIVVICLIAAVGSNSILGFRVDILLTASCALLLNIGRANKYNKGIVRC